jgi:hypothetical protein
MTSFFFRISPRFFNFTGQAVAHSFVFLLVLLLTAVGRLVRTSPICCTLPVLPEAGSTRVRRRSARDDSDETCSRAQIAAFQPANLRTCFVTWTIIGMPIRSLASYAHNRHPQKTESCESSPNVPRAPIHHLQSATNNKGRLVGESSPTTRRETKIWDADVHILKIRERVIAVPFSSLHPVSTFSCVSLQGA